MFDRNKRVILSAVLPAEGGTMTYKLTIEQAKKWLTLGEYTNYVQHDTVRLIGVEPATERLECDPDWGQALVIRSSKRLEPRREYTKEEFTAMGFDIWLIMRFESWAWGYEGAAKAVPYEHRGVILLPPVPDEKGMLYAGPGEVGLAEFLGYPPQKLGGWVKAFTIKPDDSIE